MNIDEFSDDELLKQIEVCKEELEEQKNSAEPHVGEINHLEAELYVALKEYKRRGL